MTRMMRLPPASISMRIVFAPASSAFSSNSLTTEAGRSTTSPAAILLATASGNMRIRLMEFSIPTPQEQICFRTRALFCHLFARFEGDSQLIELPGIHCARRIGHQVLRGGGLPGSDDFADGLFAGEEHDRAIQAERDA